MTSNTISNPEFKLRMAATDGGDFKKIIDKAIKDKAIREDSSFASQVVDTKCCMDFYEDFNREAARG